MMLVGRIYAYLVGILHLVKVNQKRADTVSAFIGLVRGRAEQESSLE
jgi:hypothetical protein